MELTPFQVWLEEQIAKFGNMNAFAIKLEVANSLVVHWRRGTYLPESIREAKLASVGGTSVEQVGRILDESRRLHAQRRQAARLARKPLSKIDKSALYRPRHPVRRLAHLA